MTINQKLVNTGTAGGTAINVDFARLEHAAPVRVQLSANYTTARNPGDPTRPDFTGAAQGKLDIPGAVITSGTILHLLAAEAAALVAAGKAAYV